jgi:hypothetical protein
MPLYAGDNWIVGLIAFLAVLGAAVVLGGRYAQRTGRLQSRGMKMVLLAIVFVIGFVLFLGPYLFPGRG